MPVAGNGQASLVLLIKFIYLIHAGDDFNNEKSAPFYPSLSEYWQYLFIAGPLQYSKLLYVLSICILFTIYKGGNQPVTEYTSESNERKNLIALTLSYKPSRLIASIAEITWHCIFWKKKNYYFRFQSGHGLTTNMAMTVNVLLDVQHSQFNL